MPVEIEEFYMKEKIQLIKELYAENNFKEGIGEARATIDGLFRKELRFKYYIPLCKLLSLGYRKCNKPKQAIQVINEAIDFSMRQFKETGQLSWKKEFAILHVNKGVIYESSENYIGAMEEYCFAKPIFEELKDYDHLVLLYQTMVGTFISTQSYNKAKDFIHKIKALSTQYDLNIDCQILEAYCRTIKEKIDESN